MKAITEKLSGIYISLKSRKKLKKAKSALDFPVKAREIKNTLIIFPRGLNHLDDANRFVQEVKKHYRSWSVEIFDVDKINEADLNILKLPNHHIIKRIHESGFSLVIDLNDRFDKVSAFIAVMSEATYRISFNIEDKPYFNLQYFSAGNNHEFLFQPFFDYLQSLFLKK